MFATMMATMTILFKLLLLKLTMARVAAGLSVGPPALHAWQRSVAGAGAYVAATVVTSPMDVIKTRAQAPGRKGSRNAVAVALDILRQEGVGSFFCGIAPALMMAPAAMVQYTLIDPLRARYPLWLAALIAGALDITIKCPFDRVKTQMQDSRGAGRSTAALLRDTLRTAGVRGLWTGYGATLVRDLPYLVIKWLVFAWVQSLLRVGPLAALVPAEARNVLAGAMAGGVAATVVTPADVVKTRLQLRVAGGSDTSAPPSSLAVARDVLRAEGPAGLFRGLGPRLARIPFYTSVTLATFEGIKDAFLRGAGSAGLAAAAATITGKTEL